MILQAPTGVPPGRTFVMPVSGTTYTIDAQGFVTVTNSMDAAFLMNMGFTPGPRKNLTAAADPTSGADTSQDYDVFSVWKNSAVSPARWWLCENPALGAAVWDQISVGVNTANAGSAQFINQTLTGLLTSSLTGGITPFNGGGQAGAVLMTGMFNTVSSSIASAPAYDSVRLEPVALGSEQTTWNNSANPIQLFGTGSDTINGYGSTVGITIPAGGIFVARGMAAGKWIGGIAGMGEPTNEIYNTNTATASATLTGANISGAINAVTLNLTGTLGGAANAQLPTVANLVAAIPNPVAGYSYKLRIANTSSANFAWTVITNTGWTLNGTMTVAQTAFRDFKLTLNTLTTATLQNDGGGTF
jgi:hypothetical protein